MIAVLHSEVMLSMCLIIFDWAPKQTRKLTLASNRDEYYTRPTLDAHFWQDAPDIFGGRDLKMKGTWLALSKQGRLAAVTNYRAPDNQAYDRSRGEIPLNFLSSSCSALEFAQALPKAEYAGFNALLFDGEKLVYCHNRGERMNNMSLAPGRYGLSNHLLDTAWPKVKKTKPALELASQEAKRERSAKVLLEALQNPEHATHDELPQTGIAPEIEYMLSPAFIASPNYGTRTSSVLMIEQQENKLTTEIYFWERQYRQSADLFSDKTYQIQALS